MGDHMVKLRKALGQVGAEDVFLAVGSVLLSAGCALAFGIAFGLMAAGALATAYGVWIAKGSVS